MALVLADRVLETTTTTGSGTITLAGAEPGYQSFSAVGNGNQTYYTITADTDWEVGIGTYTASGTTLSRDTVLSSSNSNAKVTFPAGVKKVFVTYPSQKSVNLDVSGNISLSSAVISGVGYPSVASDAATKSYVDNMSAAALHIHDPVVLATPASTGRNDTYNNGTAGVSATLTATANGTLTIDSTVAQAAQRVLIKDCDDQVENGIYVVTTVGDGSNPYVMTRSSDADTYGEQGANSLDEGSYFYVSGGTSLKGAAFVCNTPGVITFGSTNITFAEFSQTQVYTAGTGISLTNTVISLVSPVAVNTGGTGVTSAPTNGQLLIGNGSGYTLSTLTAGSGVSITNSAGSITLTATGTGGTVVEVKATSPLASSGGISPTISIANSTGTGSVVLDQGATISSATITAGVSASITTITGTSANITTVSGTTARFSSAAITQLSGTSAGITTVSGTTTTFSSGTITQFGATSATIATVSGTNATYSNGNFTSATVSTISGTTLNYASATLGNLWASTTISAGTTSTTGRINANEKGFTPSNTDVTKAAIVTSGSYGGGVVMNDGGIGAIWMQSTGTEMGIGVGTTSGVTNAITVRNGGATIGSLTVTTLTGTSANITTLTGTTFGTTATTQLRGASAQITTLTGVTTLSGTNFSATSITVTNTPAFVGNGTLTMNVSGTGLSGSQTFTANQSGNATFTVTSNATNANTGSTIVARDASGNFSAGTITASLNGNASTATTASNVNNGTLTMNVSGTGLSGSQTFTANQSGNATFTVTSNATSANTGSTIVARDGSGNFNMGVLYATGASLSGDITTYRSGAPTTGVVYFGNTGTRYLYWDGTNYYLNGAPLFVNGVQAVTNSGTWSIGISGNAATVTDGMYLASTQTSGGRKSFSAAQASGSMLNATGSLGGLEAVNLGGGNAAFMSFHRSGAYASYFGLDTDNQFAVGGWSAGAALANFKCLSLGVGTAASGTSGEIRATNNVTAYYSDARLKDFKGKIGDALYKISQLNGYYYTENEKAEEFGFKNKELQVGVSAQEVNAIMPEVIAPAPFDMDAENKSKSGENYMTVRYEKLVPLLIEAIKELKSEIDALKKK